MLTLERLNALRGISSKAAKSTEQKTTAPASTSQTIDSKVETVTEVVAQPQANPQKSQICYPEPVEIPCKNYMDEKDHFAYIDANTGQISHVNLEKGNIYKLEDVYCLSLKHSVEALSDEYHQLTWQQVLNDETVYDRFGCPMFTFEEIQAAYDKYIKSTYSLGENKTEDKPKTDPFGIPL